MFCANVLNIIKDLLSKEEIIKEEITFVNEHSINVTGEMFMHNFERSTENILCDFQCRLVIVIIDSGDENKTSNKFVQCFFDLLCFTKSPANKNMF